GSAFDAISGGQNNDTIIGGGGGDFLVGGQGSDTFKYLAVSDSAPGTTANGTIRYDTIADFASGQDKIDLSAIAGVTRIQGTLATATSSVNAHSIAWFTSAGTTFVYANASGNPEAPGSTDMEIHLTNGTSLTAGDFAVHAPAGVSGEPINLALTLPSAYQGLL